MNFLNGIWHIENRSYESGNNLREGLKEMPSTLYDVGGSSISANSKFKSDSSSRRLSCCFETLRTPSNTLRDMQDIQRTRIEKVPPNNTERVRRPACKPA